MSEATSSIWMPRQLLESLLSCFFKTATSQRSDCGRPDLSAHQLLEAHWAAVRLLEAQLVLNAALIVLRWERLDTCSGAKASPSES